ncbi:homocysteine S-methyltransferase family protein [Sedimentitalea sp. XS_ASV28]|uniref:homocysteine S-methyltransferase family protein n=1 Tax=Sedimentitalea sp. XS_ASV28 TaxID=3241296 RepID=UPI003510DF39
MSEITLLDGAIGQELVRRSGDRATPLWSTRVMIDKPGLVEDVHSIYFRAGATVATTNTYAVHRSRLARVGLQDQVLPLIDVALTQATRARDAHGHGRIAGSLGPLLATYRPDLRPDPAEAEEKFGALIGAMEDRVDLFLIETVSSLLEAEGILRATAKSTRPVWLSMTVDDDDGTCLRSGEPLADIAPLLDRFDPQAVLLNCSRPEAFAQGMPILAGFGRPFGGYANGFTRISEGFLRDAPTVDALEQRVDLGPEAYADHVMRWIGQGATIVGGCCEVGPDHVAELSRRLRADGHTII